MTLRNAAWAINGVEQEAEDFRLLLASLLGGVPGSDWVGGTSLGDGAHGVVHPMGLVVSEKDGTPNKSVDVAAGACILRGSENADQGAYFAYNDDVVNLPIAEPDGANPRIDLVVVKVQDVEYGVAVVDGASLAIVTGTPGAIPVAPTVPDNALVLAQINVDAAAVSITDSDIDDLRTYTALPILRCTTATLPDNPYKGMRCHLTDTGKDVIYYGATTGWRPPWGTTWGIIGHYTVADFFFNNAFSASATTFTPDLVLNRRYLIVLTVEYQNGAVTGVIDNCYVARTAASGTPLTQPNRFTAIITSSLEGRTTHGVYTAASTAATAMKVYAQATASATNQVLGNIRVTITDIGSTANPPTD